MNLNKRITILVELGKRLSEQNEEFNNIKQNAYLHNKWFVVNNINKAINSISTAFLKEEKLRKWANSYKIANESTGKKVGIIMAGNIPLVGFHDLISVFIAGHIAILKLSSKDTILMEFIIKTLIDIDQETKELIQIEERVKDIDAIIATGSNNSYRYFEYYFGKVPNIIRKNRNGTAILTGKESDDDLRKLSDDVFDYFGLGCRNISKIYVPENYNFTRLIQILDENQYLKEHNKYMNNYDYNLAIAMLNKDEIFQGEVIFLKEDNGYLSRIASIHYEKYNEISEINRRIKNDEEIIQVVSTSTGDMLDFDREVRFGNTQIPTLFDYSDGVDILDFLVNIKH